MKTISWSEVFVSTIMTIILSSGTSIAIHFLFIPIFALIQEGENSLMPRLIAHLVFLSIPIIAGWFLSKWLNPETNNLQSGLVVFFALLVQLIGVLFIDLFVAKIWQ